MIEQIKIVFDSKNMDDVMIATQRMAQLQSKKHTLADLEVNDITHCYTWTVPKAGE